MMPLLPIPVRMLLCVSSALALTSLASPTPAAAQPMYRCVDGDGHVAIGKSTPGVPPPANCRGDAIPGPKTINSQPVAQKDLEAAAEAKEAAKRQEAERVSGELRGQWLTLLENVRGARAIFGSGGSSDTASDAFSLRLEAIGRQIQSIRVKYAHQIQMGDSKTLGMAVYAAYVSLTAAGPDWQKERQAAESLAAAEVNAVRYQAIRNPSALDRANSDQSKRLLRAAHQQYEDAKAQLAAKQESLTQVMSEASRIAKEEREQTQQVSAEARNP